MGMGNQNETSINGYKRTWWKEAVVYQIYPRSFRDSNGDGIGDLNGITSSLDYLAELGVDVLWICPIFDSPNADNGYDIRDYKAIMSDFGTMEDFDRLVKEAKARGLRILLDLVPNHSSDEHQWFQQGRLSEESPYRDYYIWRQGKDGQPPNNWVSFFGGSAWEWDDTAQAYYLHLYAKKQPDLNWGNARVRREIYDIMRYWMDKGIDGFRMDVIPFISKPVVFEDFPGDFDGDFGAVYASGPRLHTYIQEMHDEVMSRYDMFTVGEAAGLTLEQTPLIIDERRRELNVVFQFDAITVDRLPSYWDWKPWSLPDLKAIYSRYEKVFDKHCWNAIFLGNHDMPRMVSRFASDEPAFQKQSAKLLATILLTLKGTPFIYQGDEIGMTNFPFESIDQFDDIQARNAWKDQVEAGTVSAEDFMDNLIKTSRDHSRTPMQWSDEQYAGFSTVEPWMAVNPNYPAINAKKAVDDPDSIYHYIQSLIQLRSGHLALIYGDYSDVDPDHNEVFIYTRTIEQEGCLVASNFSKKTLSYKLPEGLIRGRLLLSNHEESVLGASDTLQLKPYEVQLWEVKVSETT